MQISSILVALGREGDPARVLARAVMLARRFGARLELFLCEAEQAYELQHQYDTDSSEVIRQSGLVKLHAWMDQLWRSLDVNDVPVHMEAVYESPLCEAISRKAALSKPDLVVRGIGTRGHRTFSVADLDLVRSCPVPLLLTRGRPWPPAPNMAVAVDISGEESPDLIRTVLLAADGIASRCGATLDLLYASTFEQGAPAAMQSSRQLLASRAAAANVHPADVHVVNGDPATVIPQFAARRGYDILVLGALTHRKTMTALVGTLSGRLIETLDCDLLLVRPSAAPAG